MIGENTGDGMRFIPTGVGNTNIAVIGPYTVTVHPHGCGEHGYWDRW